MKDGSSRKKIFDKINAGEDVSGDLPSDIKEAIMTQFKINDKEYSNIYIDVQS
jgi:hypothetical protein